MKKIISYILIIAMVFISGISEVFAQDVSNSEEPSGENSATEISNSEVKTEGVNEIESIKASDLKIGDKFKINKGEKEYTVHTIDSDELYLNSLPNSKGKSNDSAKLNIKHFETSAVINGNTTWRIYVNLNELCSKTDICESKVIDGGKYGKEISIARHYNNTLKDTIIERNEKNEIENLEKIEREIYYTTSHEIGTNNFQSRVYVSEQQGVNPLNVKNPAKLGNFYNFGDNISDKFNNRGESTLVDVESFIDADNEVYISLRFLSEALGCRVDWLAKRGIESKQANVVLIRFYDSDSYCKKLEVTYPNPNQDEFSGKETISSSEMYNYILKIANKGTEKSMDVNINYSYWSDNSENIEQGTTKWLNLYLSGEALYYMENDFNNNKINTPLVQWNKENDTLLHFFSEVNDKNNSNTAFSMACLNNSNNGELTSLEGCIDVSGMFMYYGVPIPIRLLSTQYDEIYNNCNIDSDTYEIVTK